MPIERNEIGSLAHWRARAERPAQRFYLAFCLVTSSVQDLFLGLEERENSNLNWSATCSYYSLIHAGRLLTFLALGDFPTSHKALRSLLSEEPREAQDRPWPHGGYPFDWLQGFARVSDPEQG